MFFFRALPRSWQKERASVVYNFLAIWLVYSPNWAFLIGYYNKKQPPQLFWIKRSDRKVERLFTKVQLQLVSYCKYSSRITIILRQNIHIGRSHLERPKDWSMKKRNCKTHWREQRGMDSFLQRQISQSNCEIRSNWGTNLSDVPKVTTTCMTKFEVLSMTSPHNAFFPTFLFRSCQFHP